MTGRSRHDELRARIDAHAAEYARIIEQFSEGYPGIAHDFNETKRALAAAEARAEKAEQALRPFKIALDTFDEHGHDGIERLSEREWLNLRPGITEAMHGARAALAAAAAGDTGDTE